MQKTSQDRYSGKHRKPHGTVVLAGVLITAAAVTAVIVGTNLARRAAAINSGSDSASVQTFGKVTVDTVSLNGLTYPKARRALMNYVIKKDSGRSYTLTYGGNTYPFSGHDLHTSYNINAVLQKAWAEQHAADGAKQYHLSVTVDQATLQAKLQELTASINVQAKEPTIRSFDGSSFTFTEGTTGVQVNEAALLTDTVKAIRSSDSASIPVQVTKIPCKYTAADLKPKIVKLGSFSTVSTNTENGTYNMSRALQAVNGTVIKPGGIFSYLGVVGSADRANGYRLAGALVNGVSAQEYGGGICQGSTTVYGAAMRSNCTVVERSPHSSPSSYVPIGQDATVSYPDLDFKFKNPTDYPMYIQSGADGRTMYCTIYGYKDDSWDKIEVSSQKTGTVPPPADVVKVDKTKSASYRERTVTALNGYYATCSRTFYKNGGAVRTEALPKSYYPPRAAVYVVGASASVSSAPAPSQSAHSSSAVSQSSGSTASSKKAA